MITQVLHCPYGINEMDPPLWVVSLNSRDGFVLF
jgi:hypothetical protein